MSSKRRKTCIAVDGNYVVERPLARSINELLGQAQKLSIWTDGPMERCESSPIFDTSQRSTGTSFLLPSTIEAGSRSTKSYFAGHQQPAPQQQPQQEQPLPELPAQRPMQMPPDDAAASTIASQQPFVSWAEGGKGGTGGGEALQAKMSALYNASLRHSWVRTMSGSGAVSHPLPPQRTQSPSGLGWGQLMSASFSVLGARSSSKHIVTPSGNGNHTASPPLHGASQLMHEGGDGASVSMPIAAYLGRDLSTNERVVIWVQRLPHAIASPIRGAVHIMGTTLEQLKEVTADASMYVPGIPRCLYFDIEKERYQCLVLPALGPTLKTMLQYNGGTLSERSVLLLGLQLLHILRHCMTKHVLLNDVSPHTLRFGSSSVHRHVVYLTSFAHCAMTGTKGLLVRQSSSVSGGSSAQATTMAHSLVSGPTPSAAQQQQQLPLDKTLTFRSDSGLQSSQRENSTGGVDHLNTSSRSNTHSLSESASRNEAPAMVRSNNLYFSSARYHLGKTLSAADDLEAVGFTLVYCLVGAMPWRTLVNDDPENTLTPDATAPASDVPSNPGVDNGKKASLTAARQLFRMKEQYILHSQQADLPRPIRSLLSSTQQLAVASQAASSSAQRAPSFASDHAQRSPPPPGGANPSPDMLSVMDTLIAEFRNYLVAHYGAVVYTFDWDVLAPQKKRR